MPDLSILIPARNEIYLPNTIDSILSCIEADTEIIVVLDGYWPYEPLPDHPRVTLIHHTVPVGQRRGVNEAALISTAKYVMKLDAHCTVDQGFDAKLIKDCTDDDTTVIPRMYNLHAFDWVCDSCGERKYQGPTPDKCEKCSAPNPRKEMIWKHRISRRTDFMRFDSDMHFQYWGKYDRRPEAQGDICDLMSSVGACFFMTRRRFRRLGYMDEKHGSWGQFGTEISCKSWLSGGRQVVNKKTWFSHLFRTQGLDFGFPYEISHQAQVRAREYSQWLWKGGNWKHAVRPVSWIVDKFAPVPGWEEAVA
jgi:glycosyltransferase involved in cell wall biosynthesis